MTISDSGTYDRLFVSATVTALVNEGVELKKEVEKEINKLRTEIRNEKELLLFKSGKEYVQSDQYISFLAAQLSLLEFALHH